MITLYKVTYQGYSGYTYMPTWIEAYNLAIIYYGTVNCEYVKG